MFKPGLGQKGPKLKKRVGQGWFKHMIYLPLPFCRKKRFGQIWFKHMIYQNRAKKNKGRS